MKTTTAPGSAGSSIYSVRIPSPLKQAFDQVAALHERNGSQLVREFMREYVQSNAKQALAHEQWFSQQVQTTRKAVHVGKQSSLPAAAVHAWLATWGADAEGAAPGTVRPGRKASAGAGRKRG